MERIMVIGALFFNLTGFFLWLVRRKKSVIEIFPFILLFLWAVYRTFSSGALPFSSLYEILLSFSLFVFLTTNFLRFLNPHSSELALRLTEATGMLAIIYALTRNPEFKPLAPALRSYWFLWHISIAVLAYPIFIYSSFSTLNNSPSNHIFNTLSLGLILYFFGIVSGAEWAEEAWGGYWRWDPKETLSLLTFLIYTGLAHTFFLSNRKILKKAFAFIGLISVILTFVGINFVVKLLGLQSLHVYIK